MTDKQHNILLVANYESNVGYAWWLMENFWVQIDKHYGENDRKCLLIYPKLTELPKTIEQSSIEPLELNFEDRSKINLLKLKNLIRSESITCVYLTDKKYYDFLYFKLRLWGVKTIINHDHTPGERPLPTLPVRIIKSVIHRLNIFSCDYYIGVSKFVFDRLVNNACIQPRKCTYVHNGIYPIKHDSTLTNYSNQEFSIPANAIIVVSTGRATFYKGIDFIIECANVLVNKKNMRNLYFIHCGDGPDLDVFKDIASKYKLNDNFRFVGRRNDIPKVLQSCHIGIQASLGEAFSLSILEYLSAGLATLAPDNCGNKEAITNNVNGFLFKPGDTQEVVSLIQKLVNDENLRLRLGERAVMSIKNKFNITKANQEFISTIKKFC